MLPAASSASGPVWKRTEVKSAPSSAPSLDFTSAGVAAPLASWPSRSASSSAVGICWVRKRTIFADIAASKSSLEGLSAANAELGMEEGTGARSAPAAPLPWQAAAFRLILCWSIPITPVCTRAPGTGPELDGRLVWYPGIRHNFNTEWDRCNHPFRGGKWVMPAEA